MSGLAKCVWRKCRQQRGKLSLSNHLLTKIAKFQGPREEELQAPPPSSRKDQRPIL